MKIDSTKLKKTLNINKIYVWSGIAAVCYMVIFVCWVLGAELPKLTILCLFAGAIMGNLGLAVREFTEEHKKDDEDEEILITIINDLKEYD